MHKNTQKTIIIGISCGDLAGIGLDNCIALYKKKALLDAACVYVGPIQALQERASLYGLTLNLETFPTRKEGIKKNTFYAIDIPTINPVTPGVPDPSNSPITLLSLKTVADLCLNKTIDAMVTLPLNKYIMQQGGLDFLDHTTWLKNYCQTPDVCMFFIHKNFRVGLATIHQPLKKACELITKELITSKIEILNKTLKEQFGIKRPRIGVCGLNPHCGEQGVMGHEEQDIIIPAITESQKQQWDVQGPFASDSLFMKKQRGRFDAILALYHDQGLIPFKMSCDGQGVNFTAGLPIIRTSPDHGTAYNLAGSSDIDHESTTNACQLAIDLSLSQQKQHRD